MADFQTVKRRGHSQSANSKYSDQHQKLVEMGFDTSSVSRALETSSGNLESATALLLEEKLEKAEAEEKVVNAKKVVPPPAPAPPAADGKTKGTRQATGLAAVSGQAVREIKDVHQRMMATYKVQKCKENGNHDRRMCMHYHSLSDRRRNPFENLYSCYECPNTADGGECPDGDSCTYSHTMLERMFHPELYKISVCQRQLTGNKCDRAMLCAFAHNDADLRISPSHLTTKYAMQEEARTPPIPLNQSAMLDHIRSNLIKLIKEHGGEGVIAAELPKHYQGRFHESLDLIDELGKKYKLKDLVGPHNNIHVVLTGQPKFVFGDPSLASATDSSAASTATEHMDSDVEDTPLSNQEKVLELLKSAGADGILVADFPKRYQDKYGDKLEKDWQQGLANVVGVAVIQNKQQIVKYSYAVPIASSAPPARETSSASSVKDLKQAPASTSNSTAAAVVGRSTSGAPSLAAATSASSNSGGSKWGSSAGKSFASILSSSTPATPAGSAVPSTPTSAAATNSTAEVSKVEAKVVSEPVVPAVVVPATVEKDEKKAAAEPSKPKSVIAAKADKVESKSAATIQAASEPKKKVVEKTATTETDNSAAKAVQPPALASSTSGTLGDISLSAGLAGMQPSVDLLGSINSNSLTSSVASNNPLGAAASSFGSTPGSSEKLPKPLFSGLEGALGGLDDQTFSLGLSSGSSTLLELTGGGLTGISSSFELSLEPIDGLGSGSVLPPGLSKVIGKSSSGSASGPSLSSLIASSLGPGLGGLGSASNATRDTPERASSGAIGSSANISGEPRTASQLERDLSVRNQEVESQAIQIASLRLQLAEFENKQASHEELLRASLRDKEAELISKNQELLKQMEEVRRLKQEKLIDLDQYFIYFCKIEEAISSLNCKEDGFSEKVKQEDVHELFQFKKMVRNYVANVKLQLKHKFDLAVAAQQQQQQQQSRLKDSTVEAVAVGAVLPSSSAPSGLPSGLPASVFSSSVLSGGNVLGSATSASDVSSGTSRFANAFDHHMDAFSSSSVLFPSSNSDLGGVTGSSSGVLSSKTCGLPGCFKEGLYTCAGCRKISYCGETHQRSHWAQHSQHCYSR